MFMMYARYYVEEAERLVNEAESLVIEAGGDNWREVATRKPQLIQQAALELRLGIETAAYKALQSRRKNFDRNMFDDWRANKIIKFVSTVLDESFDADSVLRRCPTGEEDNPHAWKLIGHTKGIRYGEVNRHYNALGQLLHIHDDSDALNSQFPRIADEQKAIKKIRQVIDYLRSFEGYMDAHFEQSYARKLVMAFFQAAWVSFDITGRPSLNSIPLMISGSLFGPSSLRHRFLAEQTSW